MVTQTGPHSHRVQTRPYPDNVAYCQDNDGISFWHVIMDFEVAPS